MTLSAPSFPTQVFLGIYLGILTGIIPALVSWSLAFTFRYVTGLTVPSFAVVVLGVAIAGINGGFLAFNDPTVLQSSNSVSLLTAILVVMLISFYTHNMGDKLGANLPRRLSLGGLRERTLGRDVIELVGDRNRARFRVVGAVEDLEGYPPVGPDLEEDIAEAVTEWTFPAEQSIEELERALENRLREEFDLSAVAVTIDEQARASIAAAPPLFGLSKTVPAGRRAATVRGLLPTGIAAGDDVRLVAPPATGSPSAATTVSGRVLGTAVTTPLTPETAAAVDVEDSERATMPEPPARETCPGGDGRLTVSVDQEGARRLLAAENCGIVVPSQGTRREFELLSLLRRAQQRFRRLTVGEAGSLTGERIGEADVRDRFGVAILAVRHEGEWRIAPRGDTRIHAGDDLFIVGADPALEAFQEAVT